MPAPRRLRVVGADAPPPAAAPAIRIAFATATLAAVDQHFGTAGAFAIYEIADDRVALAEVVQFDAPARDDAEGKLAVKLEALAGCAAVYVVAVGGSAIAQLAQRRIQPVKVPDGTPIPSLIARVRRDLATRESRWLARAALRAAGPERFARMAAEGWDE